MSSIRPKNQQICFQIFALASKMWSNTKNKSTLFGSTYDNKLPLFFRFDFLDARAEIRDFFRGIL